MTTVNGVASGAAATSSDPATAKAQNSANFDSFLQLLTTQLSNQDPLNPIDATQFTSQLAQFSQVEQQIQTNSNLQTLVAAQNANQSMSSVSLLGKIVEVQGNTATLQNGSAEWNYNLSSPAALTAISIVNSQGQTVRSMTGETAAGDHQLVWDGTDNGGNQLPDGQYKIQVTSIDSNGSAVPATVDAFGLVTGVSFSSGTAQIETANGEISLANVIAVRDPQSSQTASSQ